MVVDCRFVVVVVADVRGEVKADEDSGKRWGRMREDEGAGDHVLDEA